MPRRYLVAGLAVLSALAVLPAWGDAKPRLDGIWQGAIVARPAAIELDLLVEIAPNPAGVLVGTLDLPAQRLKFLPLQSIRLDGSQVDLEFDRMPGKDVPENRFRLHGELSADGQTIHGEFTGRGNGEDMRMPFTLTRTADAGTERPREPKPPLTRLSEDGSELKQAFNRDKGKARLVLLLSPTCGTCLAAAWVTEKYVLDTVRADSLRVYVVWGPMLGEEKEEDAREATGRIPDPRVTQFWAGSQKVAEQFGRAVKLAPGKPGWETFQLFLPGATWNAEVPPPAHFMHLNLPLPEEQTLDAKKLAEQVRGALPSPSRP